MRHLLTAAAVALAGLSLSCQQPVSSTTSPRETIHIATDALFPPFHFMDDAHQVTGHDVELARAVLDRAGYHHNTLVARPYRALLSGLESGQHQLVAATTGITRERRERYRFSDPYFTTCQAVLVRRGDDEPATLSQLSGRRVGAAGSGTSAAALARLKHVTPVGLSQGEEGLEALLAGDIDAYIVDEFEAVAAARADARRLRVLSEPAAMEAYGFVMPLDRVDLQRRVNRALAALQADGTAGRIRARFDVARDDQWPVDLESDD